MVPHYNVNIGTSVSCFQTFIKGYTNQSKSGRVHAGRWRSPDEETVQERERVMIRGKLRKGFRDKQRERAGLGTAAVELYAVEQHILLLFFFSLLIGLPVCY